MQSTDFRKSAAISCQTGPTEDVTTRSALSASSGCGWQAGDPERRTHYGKSAGWDERTEKGSGTAAEATRVSTVFKKTRIISQNVYLFIHVNQSAQLDLRGQSLINHTFLFLFFHTGRISKNWKKN